MPTPFRRSSRGDVFKQAMQSCRPMDGTVEGIDFIPCPVGHGISAGLVGQNILDRLFSIIRRYGGHAFQHAVCQGRGVRKAALGKARNGIELHVFAGKEQDFLSVPDTRRKQGRAAAHTLKNAEVQVSLFTDIDDKAGARKECSVVSCSDFNGDFFTQQLEEAFG